LFVELAAKRVYTLAAHMGRTSFETESPEIILVKHIEARSPLSLFTI